MTGTLRCQQDKIVYLHSSLLFSPLAAWRPAQRLPSPSHNPDAGLPSLPQPWTPRRLLMLVASYLTSGLCCIANTQITLKMCHEHLPCLPLTKACQKLSHLSGYTKLSLELVRKIISLQCRCNWNSLINHANQNKVGKRQVTKFNVKSGKFQLEQWQCRDQLKWVKCEKYGFTWSGPAWREWHPRSLSASSGAGHRTSLLASSPCTWPWAPCWQCINITLWWSDGLNNF